MRLLFSILADAILILHALIAESFVTHWMQRLLFYEADDRVFAAAYAAFLLLTALTLVAVKPLPPAWRRRRD